LIAQDEEVDRQRAILEQVQADHKQSKIKTKNALRAMTEQHVKLATVKSKVSLKF